jgi:predicted dehydrogenase
MLGFAHVHAAGYADTVKKLPNAELIAISEPDPELRGDAIARFGGEGYQYEQELLERDDIDAVIVMSETSAHEALVTRAAEAGKHILCEKPLATSYKGGQEIVSTLEQHPVKFQTVFPMRFSRAAIALREMIREGAVGTPIAVKSTNPGRKPGGWFGDPILAGGGAIMDHTVHVADLLRWIFDQEIVEVYAEVDTRIYPGAEVDDIGLLMLKLSGGLTASLDSSWSRPASWPTWGGLTLEVIGDRGVLAMDAFRERVELIENRGPRHEYLSWGDDSSQALVRAFIAAIENDTETSITVHDGLRATEVALCAYESAKRKAPVACPEVLLG